MNRAIFNIPPTIHNRFYFINPINNNITDINHSLPKSLRKNRFPAYRRMPQMSVIGYLLVAFYGMHRKCERYVF
jgi:hypothetical protein